MTFSEPIDLAGVTVSAVDEHGEAVALDLPRLDPSNDRRLVVSSDDFSIGSYTVSWSNRSTTDGHTLSGSFAFRVGGTDRAPAAATVEGERPPAWAVLLRWLAFLGAAPAAGLLLYMADDRRQRIAAAGLAVAVIATMLDPVLLSAFPPSGSVGGSIGDAVRAEPDGWWVRFIGFVAAFAMCFSRRIGETWRQAVGAAALIGIAGLALTSHAAGRESFAWAAVGVAFLHNAAVAIWIGALALIALGSDRDRIRELGQFAKRALPLAAIAVILGIINAGLIFPDIDTVTSTDYGWVLIAKVAVVLIVLGLAAYHHLTLRRSIGTLPRLMRSSIRLELGLVAIAVAFASTLALLAPPQVSRGDVEAIELAMPTTSELTTDQIYVRLKIDPARTGENTLTAYATQGPPLTVETDDAGAPEAIHHPPLADVQLMRLDLTSLELAIGPRSVEMTPIGDGRFETEGVNFSADGWWRAIVTVRRAGAAEDLTAEFILRTPDPNVVGFDDGRDESSEEAEALYVRTRDQLAQQDWVVFKEDLSGGTGGVEISSQVWSNGSLHISTPSIQLIRTNGMRYLLDQSGEWRVTDDSDPRGPTGWVEELDGATNFTLGNVEEIDGREAQLLHFFVPGTVLAPAYYSWWIDIESGQILQEAMISRSHYMIKRYDWSAPPPEIVPPV